MSEQRAALEQLAALVGIATFYHDVHGNRHEATDASLTALLRDFGIDPDDPQRAAHALRLARWNEILPPVAAISESTSDWTVRMQYAIARERALRWVLMEENGATHEGPLDPHACAELERTAFDGGAFVARALAPGVALPMGYHRLALYDDAGCIAECLLIAAPARSFRPESLDDNARIWGPALQLYGIRSERNWGIGDFTDLVHIVEQWAARGAGIIGLNPLHALYPHNPWHISPYSPSARSQLNVLYVDIEAIDEYRESETIQRHVQAEGFQERLRALRATPLVDYPGVAAAKFEALELVYARFRTQHLEVNDTRARAFRAFQARGGEVLRRHALFEALQEHFHRIDPATWGWPLWPEEYRDPDSEAVARFAVQHVARVEYFEYLQWQAGLQLSRAGARCQSLGLALGLYMDLAVSVDRGGSDAWAHRDCYAQHTSVGAPPDDFSPKGQNWGLPPFSSERLRANRYAPLIEALRANMRSAGALRIDHVMGLMRIFCIPPNHEALDGSYVHYALDEMMAIVALESHRNRCLVIGEDLGTVADEMRNAMQQRGVLSYRLLWFEREHDALFRAPERFPQDALVAVSTHDLPTLAGWWTCHDVPLRASLGLYPREDLHQAELRAREADRPRLIGALRYSGALPADVQVDTAAGLADAVRTAVHAHLARSPSRVMVVQIEDVLGVIEQANLPGTVDEHPNWKRKLPLTLEQLGGDANTTALGEALSAVRPHPARPPLAVRGEIAVIPRATYRVQLNHAFTFDDATRLVPYLARLGISHLYCSPILRARAGSLHGYDIVDHGQINPELGGREGFERLIAALRTHGMGVLLDIVPNHMGVLGADNEWWMDVLEHGPSSPYADYFDIDWQPVNADLVGKVLVPALGDHYGLVVERGELRLVFEPDRGAFAVRYFEHRFPIDPQTYPLVLGPVVAALRRDPPLAANVRHELAGLLNALGRIAPRLVEDREQRAQRARDAALLKERLARLARDEPGVTAAIDAALVRVNAPRGDALHALLEAQAYRLAFWRVASDEINYRRFFDINDLAALRQENEAVFDATHALTLQLAIEGKVDGLRIDHPDGLFDPREYFNRIQESYARLAGLAAPQADAARAPRPLYLVIEKIAAGHEHVPMEWPIHGTTGYRFGAVLNGLFVDPAAKNRIDRIWRVFTGLELDFEEAAYLGRRAIMRNALASELTVLATELLRIARADRRTRDYTLNTLRSALAEVAACMPVYRTYVAGRPSAQDRRFIDWAIGRATRRSRAADTSIFQFVRQVLLGRGPEAAPREVRRLALRFAMKFQQFSAPVMAKGVEDSAFYVFNRMASLNEVGSEPSVFGMPVRAFHGASADRATNWPYTMLATSTHDNKRSEDVRARIDTLSERPAAWRLLLRRWRMLNRAKRRTLNGAPAPSPNDEYLLYQTLLGTFPEGGVDAAGMEAYRGRIQAYMVKAAREAKTNTSWINPNDEYEAALTGFVQDVLNDTLPNLFLDDLRTQGAQIAWFGALNTVSMTLVKFTSPGVPDIYQGNELLDLSLVDPDNRRPVDYAQREALLGQMRALSARPDRAAAVREFANTPHDGRAKFYITMQMLALRSRHPALFRDGLYEPLSVEGSAAAHAVAYARVRGRRRLVVIAARLFVQLLGETGRLPLGTECWGDTAVVTQHIADGTRLVNVLTGETLTVADGRIAVGSAFADFPGAVLVDPELA